MESDSHQSPDASRRVHECSKLNNGFGSKLVADTMHDVTWRRPVLSVARCSQFNELLFSKRFNVTVPKKKVDNGTGIIRFPNRHLKSFVACLGAKGRHGRIFIADVKAKSFKASNSRNCRKFGNGLSIIRWPYYAVFMTGL